jgi:ABC-2 type transport system permease protein
MIPILRWTLWQRRWSILWWSVGVFALIFLNLVFYPSFRDQAAELQKSFENLPDAAVQLFGGSTDFFSPIGFLNSQVFFFMLPLLLGMLAIGMGSSLLAREEQDMTIETLLARPVSRTNLLVAKSLAGFIILSIVTIAGLVTTLVVGKFVDLDVSTLSVILATLDCFLLVLSFGAVAFVLSAIGKARGASLGIASLVAIGGYLVSSLSGTVDWLKAPSKIFPFHYYQPEAVLRETYNWNNVLFLIGLTVACGLLSWLAFRRRDIG